MEYQNNTRNNQMKVTSIRAERTPRITIEQSTERMVKPGMASIRDS